MPRTYKPAYQYLGKIKVVHEEQKVLKEQVLTIFSRGEDENTLIRRIQQEFSEGLLV